jgi:RND family efflux transporter MFP subunit
MSPRRPRRFLRLRYLLPLVVLAGLGLAGWSLLQPFGAAPQAAGTRHTVALGTIEETLLVTGLVKPAVTIELRSEASGIVEAVSVDDGDRVIPGQELLRLDSRVAQAALQEAEASLRQAEMQQTAAELDLDEDTVQLRKKTLERTQSLFDKGLASRSDLEVRQLELRSAERAMERARRNLQTSSARIEQLKAAADRARAQLQHTIVRAPIEAWVIKRHVEVGSGVAGVTQSPSGGTVVVTLGDARQASLQAKVTAGDAKKLKPGMTARLRLDSDPDRVVLGTVQSVATAGEQDQSTRLTTFPVVIAITQTAESSWINVPAQAEIVIEAHRNAVVIPESCLRTDRAGRGQVQVDGTAGAALKSIEVGAIQGGRAQVLSGLEAGVVLLCRG